MKYISLFSGIGGFERGIEQSTKKKEIKWQENLTSEEAEKRGIFNPNKEQEATSI